MNVKYDRLIELIRGMGPMVVAYSGGVDSSLLLKAAHDALGDLCLAVTAVSPTSTAEEIETAGNTAALIGARHEMIKSGEFDDAEFVRNNEDRCYHCKRIRFKGLLEIVRREGFSVFADGTNTDDLSDFRPGHRAGDELGVRRPLLEAGLSKADVRELSRRLGLPGWDRPSNACLASRIPFGTPLDTYVLKRIEAAESEIRRLGLKVLRVRAHGDLARIETAPEEIERAFGMRREISSIAKKSGFGRVALDIEGKKP
jgi:uncharacterized protein